MLEFKHKKDTSVSYYKLKNDDESTLVGYKHLILVIETARLETIMNALRYTFCSPTANLEEIIESGLLKPQNIFYQIPFEYTYINKYLNRISVTALTTREAVYFVLPTVLNSYNYNILLEPNLDPDDKVDAIIGRYDLKSLLMFSKHFIHIPTLLNTDPIALKLIQDWYAKIRFVKSDGIIYPILVGDDVFFNSKPTGPAERTDLGISPEYPNILIRKLYRTAQDSIYNQIVFSNYHMVYKYLVFSQTMPDQPAMGYIGFQKTYEHNQMVHMELNGFGRNLEGKDLIYLIASATVGGRTEEKFCLFNNRYDDTKSLYWDKGANIYGPDHQELSYGNDYLRRLKNVNEKE